MLAIVLYELQKPEGRLFRSACKLVKLIMTADPMA